MERKEQLEPFVIPESLKAILEKLPTPEAVRVLEDIGKTAWVIDNNNNNNNTSGLIEERFLKKMASIPSKQLIGILEAKE